jgi:hypothetical protein
MHGYSLAPSIGSGDFLTFATGPQRTDGEKPAVARKPALSFGLPAVEGRFFEGFGLMRDRHAERFLSISDDAADDHAAVNMWGLSCICVSTPPATAAETMKLFEEYVSEASAGGAVLNPFRARTGRGLPEWLEKRIVSASSGRK